MEHKLAYCVGKFVEDQMRPYSKIFSENTKENFTFKNLTKKIKEEWEKNEIVTTKKFPETIICVPDMCLDTFQWLKEGKEVVFSGIVNKNIISIFLSGIKKQDVILEILSNNKIENVCAEIYNITPDTLGLTFSFNAKKINFQDIPIKTKYKNINEFAELYYGYITNSKHQIGYYFNKNGKYSNYTIGGRWDGFLMLKDKRCSNAAKKKDIDWTDMYEKQLSIAEFNWNEHQKDIDKGNKEISRNFYNIKEDENKKQYVERHTNIYPDIVIFNGEWEEKETYVDFYEWSNVFFGIMDKAGEDELITVLDCKI